jgi:hypothetical protein
VFRGVGERERRRRRNRPQRWLRGLLFIGWCGLLGLIAGATIEGEGGAVLATSGFMTTLTSGAAFTLRLVTSWFDRK